MTRTVRRARYYLVTTPTDEVVVPCSDLGHLDDGPWCDAVALHAKLATLVPGPITSALWHDGWIGRDGDGPWVGGEYRGDVERELDDELDGHNLDCMSAEDLRALAKSPEPLDPMVREYAMLKARAMECRLAGEIPDAVLLEAACERIYHKLDPKLQW